MTLFDRFDALLTKKNVAIILTLIVSVGFFLRAYKFHEFQRFDEDHVRDMRVIEQLDADKNFLIMGPVAKYTEYHLGPIYYYFEYVSYTLFGPEPGNLAYPSLLFSALSIPLLYVVLRRYFAKGISLALVGVYSVSLNSIEYARFEWNCNLIPFFVLAFFYLMLKFLSSSGPMRLRWLVAQGVVIGVGVHLHTFMIFLLLPMAFWYWYGAISKRKTHTWKHLGIVCMVVVALNMPSFIWDSQRGWSNTRSFVKAVIEENIFNRQLPHRFLADTKCYIQGNSYVISTFNQNSSCELFDKQNKESYGEYLLNIAFASLLTVGGLLLLHREFRRNRNPQKREFLKMFAIYVGLTFFMFLPMADLFDKRYFIIAFLCPFVLLGFWLAFLLEKCKSIGLALAVGLVGALMVTNYLFVHRMFIANPNQYIEENEYCGINLLVAEEISARIMELSEGTGIGNAYLSTPLYMRGYRCVIEYFVHKQSALRLTSVTKSERSLLESGAMIVYVQRKNDPDAGMNRDDYVPVEEAHGTTYDIYLLKKK